MIRSPGTKDRACPPPVPEEILTLLDLMGLKILWTKERRFIITSTPSGIVTEQHSWGSEDPVTPENWKHLIGIIADDLQRIHGGTMEKKKLKAKDWIEMGDALLDTDTQRAIRASASSVNPFADAVLGTVNDHSIAQTDRPDEP